MPQLLLKELFLGMILAKAQILYPFYPESADPKNNPLSPLEFIKMFGFSLVGENENLREDVSETKSRFEYYCSVTSCLMRDDAYIGRLF